MLTIQTTGRVGADGMLRLEVPFPPPDRDVRVVVVIHEQSAAAEIAPEAEDQWAAQRREAAANPEAWAGIRIPAPGSWNERQPVRLPSTEGLSLSDELVRDRR